MLNKSEADQLPMLDRVHQHPYLARTMRSFVVATLLVASMVLTGCVAAPSMPNVLVFQHELDEAEQLINTKPVAQPRNLARSDWQPTLDRVMDKIRPAARETCLSVGAKPCELVGQHVYIEVDPSINATVNVYGMVNVHSGLLRHAASDDEIAAVLAHEYGHYFAEHLRKKNHNRGIGTAWFLLLSFMGGYYGMDTGTTSDLATDVYDEYASANSSQFEIEADLFAALILERAGIDLEGGLDLLVRLARTGAGSTQGRWEANAGLMATTHPANSWRIASWLALSNAFDWSKRASPSQNDSELRLAALSELVAVPIQKDKVARWVNPKNGHAGTMTIKHIRDLGACRTPNFYAQCVEYLQQDYSFETSGAENRYVCVVPSIPGDDNSWEWVYAGTAKPWKMFKNGCPDPAEISERAQANAS